MQSDPLLHWQQATNSTHIAIQMFTENITLLIFVTHQSGLLSGCPCPHPCHWIAGNMTKLNVESAANDSNTPLDSVPDRCLCHLLTLKDTWVTGRREILKWVCSPKWKPPLLRALMFFLGKCWLTPALLKDSASAHLGHSALQLLAKRGALSLVFWFISQLDGVSSQPPQLAGCYAGSGSPTSPLGPSAFPWLWQSCQQPFVDALYLVILHLTSHPGSELFLFQV